MPPLFLSAETTALVLIDLQRGITKRKGAPHATATVLKHARKLAKAFRAAGGTVAYVHVNLAEILKPIADAPSSPPGSPPPPPSASQLSPAAGFQAGDLLVMKRHWGAFYGTALDQQLRRRGIKTIVLGGIATNYGVESTARAAAERAYEQIFVEDAMTSLSAEAHAFSVKHVLARIGRVRSTADVIAALNR